MVSDAMHIMLVQYPVYVVLFCIAMWAVKSPWKEIAKMAGISILGYVLYLAGYFLVSLAAYLIC